MNKNIKRLQAKGYPVKSILDIIQNDDKTDTIVYTSPEFQPCAGIRLEENNSLAIREAVNRVLEEKSYQENARKISEGFKSCTGAKRAADKILQVCR
ncbi:MAG: hypothetical protein ACOCNC_00900 [Acetivibrio ethanolgignens]